MSISYQVLGRPGFDNALFVKIDTGQGLERLLFDCGAGCVPELSVSEILQIDHLCFSHFHMDHVGGFDDFFRVTFNRPEKPVTVWGPPETSAIMQHRFRGFLWNLSAKQPGTWYVNDIFPTRVETFRFATKEAFAMAHPFAEEPFDGVMLDRPGYSVVALHMNHHTPSLAYVVREKPRLKVDVARLAELGLAAGPWLHELKQPGANPARMLEIDGVAYRLGELRAELISEQPGASLAYLTDFLLDDEAVERLAPALAGVDTLVCECQYRASDQALALRHYHMTTVQTAGLARRAGVGQLVLIHLSARYPAREWREMLAEARAIFPNTVFPAHWQDRLPR